MSRPTPPNRALRNGPPSPLFELGVTSPSADAGATAGPGPSTRRRSLLIASPMADSTPLTTRGHRTATAAATASTSTNTKARPASSHVPTPKAPKARGSADAKSKEVVDPESTGTRHARQTSTPLSDPNPSPLPIAHTTSIPSAPSTPSKGVVHATAPTRTASPRKAKAPEKRVLPARIRRTAGAGDGIRDLEDMIVDWLERYCEPCNTPPESLILHLTTLPLHLIEPPVAQLPQVSALAMDNAGTSQPANEAPVDAAAGLLPAPVLLPASQQVDERIKIEVPTWRMATSAEDDEEEAREEVRSRGLAGKAPLSPVKRLRTAFVGHESSLEDTSDAYYMALHKRYEVFERKQRLREKEKLQFERYKMRSRVDLLRTMSIMGWTSLVGTVLARPRPLSLTNEEWERGKEKIKKMGADWLRDVLVREGQEVLQRYDFLLPVEARKPKGGDSRMSTPAPSSSIAPTPSVSPPPILNARVAALRDPTKSDSTKKRQASPLGSRDVSTPSNQRGNNGRRPRHSENSASRGSGSSSRKRKRNNQRSESISPPPPEKGDEDEDEDEDADEDVEEGRRNSGKVIKTYGRASGPAKSAEPKREVLVNGGGANYLHTTPTIIKTRPSRSSNATEPMMAPTPTAATRSTRRNLLSPSNKLAIAPRSDGSSISPDEIRDMREVEAAVVI